MSLEESSEQGNYSRITEITRQTVVCQASKEDNGISDIQNMWKPESIMRGMEL